MKLHGSSAVFYVYCIGQYAMWSVSCLPLRPILPMLRSGLSLWHWRQDTSRSCRLCSRRYVQASKEAWFSRPVPMVASQVTWDGYKYAEELGCAAVAAVMNGRHLAVA